ncbi:ABC transporter substrate-binding protein [Afifella sp. JA880]|uniref:ABC transporter substrate-binding protein n=1 Tax=Afifella sp. JA880 TaxID=2975280 RepID=UPI0021BA645E|nr:ABC transporter substrate-binding protein [Afifella sp. JA880]MCT8268998.1 ABC transporter substrate-binding protein [Afifella sp. JA880]
MHRKGKGPTDFADARSASQENSVSKKGETKSPASTPKGLSRLALNRRHFLAAGAATLATPYLSKVARAQGSDVNVGVVVPLSGANAQFGVNSRNGIQLAADQINDNGGIKALGGAKINLIIADSTSTPTNAATVGQRLIAQQNVVAILGAYASSLSLALSEATERRDVPLLTMSFSDMITGRGFKNVFQVISKATTMGAAQLRGPAGVAEKAGKPLKSIAIMYEDTAFGTSQAGGLRETAAELGIEVVMDEAYPLGITDVTPLINQLRGTNADAVFPCSYLNDGVQIIRTMRQQGIDMPVIGGAGGYVIPDFRAALGEYAENVFSVAPSNYDLAPELTDPFKERFGYFMVHEAIEHAVCLDVLAKALEISGDTDSDALREALRNNRFEGGWAGIIPGGGVDFDETGLNTLAKPIIVQWRGEDLVTVWPDDVATKEAVWAGK